MGKNGFYGKLNKLENDLTHARKVAAGCKKTPKEGRPSRDVWDAYKYPIIDVRDLMLKVGDKLSDEEGKKKLKVLEKMHDIEKLLDSDAVRKEFDFVPEEKKEPKKKKKKVPKKVTIKATKTKPIAPKKPPTDVQTYTQKMDDEIIEIFTELREKILALGDDIKEVPTTRRLSFKCKRSFAMLRFYKKHLMLYLKHVKTGKDVIHYGNSFISEVRIASRSDMEKAFKHIENAYSLDKP